MRSSASVDAAGISIEPRTHGAWVVRSGLETPESPSRLAWTATSRWTWSYWRSLADSLNEGALCGNLPGRIGRTSHPEISLVGDMDGAHHMCSPLKGKKLKIGEERPQRNPFICPVGKLGWVRATKKLPFCGGHKTAFLCSRDDLNSSPLPPGVWTRCHPH